MTGTWTAVNTAPTRAGADPILEKKQRLTHTTTTTTTQPWEGPGRWGLGVGGGGYSDRQADRPLTTRWCITVFWPLIVQKNPADVLLSVSVSIVFCPLSAADPYSSAHARDTGALIVDYGYLGSILAVTTADAS